MEGRHADWDQLLMRSEDLVQKEVDFPRVERDILQIEHLSQRLRSKATRADRTTEVLDASRLLAQEGVNPRKLTQALQNFELHPSYEDVFPTEAASIGEYLQQVHERIAATAIKDVQQSTVAAFDNHMDAYMEASWASKRQSLLDSAMPFSGSTVVGRSAPGLQSPYNAPTTYPGSGNGGLSLRGQAGKYAQVVRKINAALAAGQQYDSVSEFAAACGDNVPRDKRSTMLRVWQVAQRELDGIKGLPVSARSQREAALIAGARKYLQENFVAYMENVVHSHRAQAALGGVPSRINLVQAFIRVKERERGVLDFDQPGGVDTAWLRAYLCLRAGFIQEAVQVVKAAKDAPRPGGVDVSRAIQEWSEGGNRPLSGDTGSAVASECERLLRDKSLSGSRHPYHAHRVMVHALLAGSNRTADAIVKEHPAFFSTIEDFLWLKLGLVRPGGRGVLAAAAGQEAYSLIELQQYLQQYPPTHYSHGGREPLLYVVVLLLSLQFGAGIAFLAKDATTADYRLDAVHLGICLWQAGVLESSDDPSSVASLSATVEGSPSGVGSLVHRYGREFLHADPQLALEYYMLAAAAMGGSPSVRGALLREILSESRAYGLMLGSGGAAGEGGALAAFVPDAHERARVLVAVASECAAQAQLEEATELFMFAGRPRQALRILNQRLSNVVEAAATDAGKSEEAETLIMRGNAAVSALGTSTNPEDLQEIEAFENLKSIRAMLAASARGDRTRVLQYLGELPFVPTERFRLQLCSQSANSLHPAVADRLQAVLLVAAEALAAGGKQDELQSVIAYAAAVPNRVTQATYKRLNQLQAMAA